MATDLKIQSPPAPSSQPKQAPVKSNHGFIDTAPLPHEKAEGPQAYIGKIYNALDRAYGGNGAVEKDLLSSSYDYFSSKLQKSPAYAHKVYDNLVRAFGPDGVMGKDVFPLTMADFYKKVQLNPDDSQQKQALDILNHFHDKATGKQNQQQSSQSLTRLLYNNPAIDTSKPPQPVDPNTVPIHSPETKEKLSAAVKKDQLHAMDRFWYVADKMGEAISDGVAETSKLGVLLGSVASHPFATSEFSADEANANAVADKAYRAMSKLIEDPNDKHANDLIENEKGWAGTLTRLSGSLGQFAMQMSTGHVGLGLSAAGQADRELVQSAKAKGITPTATQRLLYSTFIGGATAAILSSPVTKALEKTEAGTLAKKIAGKVLADAIREEGGKITGKVMERAAAKLSDKMISKIRYGGSAALTNLVQNAAYTGALAAADIGTKAIYNKTTADNVFEPGREMLETVKQMPAQLGAFALLSAIGGFGYSHTNEYLKALSAQVKTPEDLAHVHSVIDDLKADGKITGRQMQTFKDKVKKYAGLNGLMPKDAPADLKAKLYDKMDDYVHAETAFEAESKQLADEKNPLFSSQNQDHVQQLKAARDLIRDQIEETIQGQKFEYYEADGTYYRKMGDKVAPIAKELYKLAQNKKILEDITEKDKIAIGIKPATHNPVLDMDDKYVDDNKWYTVAYPVPKTALPQWLQQHVVVERPEAGKPITYVRMSGADAKALNKDIYGTPAAILLNGADKPLPEATYRDYNPLKPVEAKITGLTRVEINGSPYHFKGDNILNAFAKDKEGRVVVTLFDDSNHKHTFEGTQALEIYDGMVDRAAKEVDDYNFEDEKLKGLSLVEKAIAVAGDENAVKGLSDKTGVKPNKIKTLLNSIIDNSKTKSHESEIKETGTVKGETGESTQTPGTQGSHQKGEGRQLQERLTTPGEQIPEKGGAAQKAAPPSFVLNPEEKTKHVQDLDKKIEGLRSRGKEFEDAGNKKQADRLAKDADNVRAKKEFTDKTDMKLDDVINHLKELKRLKIDCKGKGATIRKK